MPYSDIFINRLAGYNLCLETVLFSIFIDIFQYVVKIVFLQPVYIKDLLLWN